MKYKVKVRIERFSLAPMTEWSFDFDDYSEAADEFKKHYLLDDIFVRSKKTVTLFRTQEGQNTMMKSRIIFYDEEQYYN